MKVTWLLMFNMTGCFITLLALFLAQTKIWTAHSLRGLAINGLGGLILAVGALFGVVAANNLELLPWVILNSTWTLISMVNFVREWKKTRKKRSNQHQVPSSVNLPAFAYRSNPNQPVCEHIADATWKSVEREDGKWEWESDCHLCGIQTWHMKDGWSKAKDHNGNVIYVQQWHAKALPEDMTMEEKRVDKIF